MQAEEPIGSRTEGRIQALYAGNPHGVSYRERIPRGKCMDHLQLWNPYFSKMCVPESHPGVEVEQDPDDLILRYGLVIIHEVCHEFSGDGTPAGACRESGSTG
jgi:hypothetical protein